MTHTSHAMQSNVLASRTRGDPLADAVIAEFDASPALDRAWIGRGILHGRASLETCPPALDALLRQAESVASPGDGACQRGSDAWLSIPAFWQTVALGPGSLAHTYSSPVIAKVLVNTQNLQARAARRLAETSMWTHQVVRPRGLARGAPGYVHTLQVRLLHARVRAATLRSGWNVAERGVPISQQDLLRTWFDFTVVPFGALDKLGLPFTDDAIADLYAMWHGVAHLLGIEPTLFRDIVSQQQAAEVLGVINASLLPPNADSRALTGAMLEAVGQLMAPALQMPLDVATGLMQTLCRHIHGDALADALGVERSWTASLLPALTDANRYRRANDLASEAQLRQRIETTLKEFDAVDSQVHGDTTYQVHARELSASGFPVTPTVAAPAATAA